MLVLLCQPNPLRPPEFRFRRDDALVLWTEHGHPPDQFPEFRRPVFGFTEAVFWTIKAVAQEALALPFITPKTMILVPGSKVAEALRTVRMAEALEVVSLEIPILPGQAAMTLLETVVQRHVEQLDIARYQIRPKYRAKSLPLVIEKYDFLIERVKAFGAVPRAYKTLSELTQTKKELESIQASL